MRPSALDRTLHREPPEAPASPSNNKCESQTLGPASCGPIFVCKFVLIFSRQWASGSSDANISSVPGGLISGFDFLAGFGAAGLYLAIDYGLGSYRKASGGRTALPLRAAVDGCGTCRRLKGHARATILKRRFPPGGPSWRCWAGGRRMDLAGGAGGHRPGELCPGAACGPGGKERPRWLGRRLHAGGLGGVGGSALSHPGTWHSPSTS